MSYSQKYCLVQPLEPLETGYEFAANDWPLHVTILGVFALDWSRESYESFAELVKTHAVFSSQTTSIEYFGPRGDVKVRLVEPNDSLRALHADTAHFVERHGGRFNDLQYQFDGFRPHATMRGDQPAEDVTISFNELVLIDMFPEGDHTRRKIIKRFPLDTL